jgi:pyruvate kinase
VESGALSDATGKHNPRSKGFLCILGPSSLNERVIPQLEAVGVTSFRINMSHTDIVDLEPVIRMIQRCTRVPICIDTEGAQIRTGAMAEGTAVREGNSVRLVADPRRGDAATIPLTPGYAVERLAPGTWMNIDFDSVILRIDRMRDGAAEATVVSGGEIGTRKAVTPSASVPLSTFSEKDPLAIRIALQHEIHEFALSF